MTSIRKQTESQKLLSRSALVEALVSLRASGSTVGFTSGAFDILHAGHLDYLRKAKQHCDLLVVGVNSDRSYVQYKSQDGPYNHETDRAELISGLDCVDFVFLFDEVNNAGNIEALKPDFYIKGGDYDISQLSSAPLVESHGGRVLLIPLKSGYSTTNLVNKIVCRRITHTEPALNIAQAPAIFVDRDGTINEHVEYIHDPAEFRPIPGALEALKHCQDLGYRIVVITNQPGIGLGYYSKEDFYRVNLEMFKHASKIGLFFDKIYFSTETKNSGNQTRKPNPYFVTKAVQDLNIDLEQSVFVGDTTTDIQCAKNAGVKSVLVKTGKGGSDGVFSVLPDFTIGSLAEIVGVIPGFLILEGPAELK